MKRIVSEFIYAGNIKEGKCFVFLLKKVLTYVRMSVNISFVAAKTSEKWSGKV